MLLKVSVWRQAAPQPSPHHQRGPASEQVYATKKHACSYSRVCGKVPALALACAQNDQAETFKLLQAPMSAGAFGLMPDQIIVFTPSLVPCLSLSSGVFTKKAGFGQKRGRLLTRA